MSERSFQCQEPRCTGELSESSRKVSLEKQGEKHQRTALACPLCGRLHYEDGKAVFNDQFQKAICHPSGYIEYRPMLAHEHREFVQERTDHLVVKSKHDEPSLYEEMNSFLSNGHAPDCPTLHGNGGCDCGIAPAEKWMFEYVQSAKAERGSLTVA